MAKQKWQKGSFLDNFNTVTLHLGYDDLPLAWHLAKVPWKSIEDRDTFLSSLTNMPQGSSELTAPSPDGRPM
jgi:hypothetical protein